VSITRLPFEEVFADESGGNIKTPQSEYLREGQFPVVDQGKALIAGYVDEEERVCGGGKPAIVFGDHTRCVKYIDHPFCMGADGVKVLRPKIDADLKYLYYYLKQLHLPDAGYDRHFKYLKRTEVVLFPLPEQRRIAAILDKADSLRTKRRKALAQLDRLAQSIFVEMFGEPATNPEGWPVRTLKELGKVSTGGTPPSALEGMFGGDIPFVTPGDLESDQPVRRTVTVAGALEAGAVRAGAALVCCIGATIGKMGIAAVRSSFNQQLNAVEWFSEQVDDHYGLAALRFFKPTIIAWGASTTLPILKKSSFEKVSIPVPPIAMQQEFAKRSLAVARLGEKLRNGMSVDASLFAALQDRAFQGSL
jgi:type I restriction enzyme, S subunit